MSAPRKFDHDEARTLSALGRRYSVSRTAVKLVVDADARAADRERTKAWQNQGRCIDCGTQVTRFNKTERHRCMTCAAVAQATSAREGELRCMTCAEWKPDAAFPGDRRRIARRGRHRQCTPCQTAARQAYRERHKAPCVRCGDPCLPVSEKGSNAIDSGLCRPCWVESRRSGMTGRFQAKAAA